MGILDDYNVDLDDFEANSFDVPDGVYDFAIGEVDTQDGSKARPDQPMLYIHYLLTSEDGKNYTRREYYDIPIDPNSPTDNEKLSMGRLKSRILSLGFEEGEVNSVGPQELVGITGSLQLASSTGKNGRSFQNVRNVRVDEEDEAPAPAPAPRTARRAQAAPAKPAAKPVDKPVSKPKAEPEPDDEVAGAPDVSQLPENDVAESDADIKARIEARRAARRAAAGR